MFFFTIDSKVSAMKSGGSQRGWFSLVMDAANVVRMTKNEDNYSLYGVYQKCGGKGVS